MLQNGCFESKGLGFRVPRGLADTSVRAEKYDEGLGFRARLGFTAGEWVLQV